MGKCIRQHGVVSMIPNVESLEGKVFHEKYLRDSFKFPCYLNYIAVIRIERY